MFFSFVESVIVDFLRFLFLLGDFFVKIWLLYALFLFNLPLLVFLKRFAADLFVFCFGIIKSSYYLLSFRADDHSHTAAFHLGFFLHNCHFFEGIRKICQNVLAV